MTKPSAPFDWYEPRLGGRLRPDAREAMYLAELRERAALLHRLGYDRTRARARLRANVAWDFELHDVPGFAAKIDGIVDDVYGRGGFTAGGPPPL
jgi:hypothetical protein